MPLPLRDLYLEALELFTVEALAASEWVGLRSACDEWSIGDVVRHVIAMQRGNVLGPLHGLEPVGGGPQVDDVAPMAAISVWEGVAIEAHAAVTAAPETALRGLYLPAMDLTMHAWDIRWGVARVGLAEQLELPASLVAFLEGFRARADEEALRASGVFGEARVAAHGASPTAVVMAWAGRAALPVAGAPLAG